MGPSCSGFYLQRTLLIATKPVRHISGHVTRTKFSGCLLASAVLSQVCLGQPILLSPVFRWARDAGLKSLVVIGGCGWCQRGLTGWPVQEQILSVSLWWIQNVGWQEVDIFLTDICNFRCPEDIMGDQNFNFAPKFLQNGFSTTHFVFLEANTDKLKFRGGNCPPPPLLHPGCPWIGTDYSFYPVDI